MPAKMARSAPRPPSGLPEVTVAVRIALLPCREPGKPRIFTAIRESSGESQVTAAWLQYRAILKVASRIDTGKSPNGLRNALGFTPETRSRHDCDRSVAVCFRHRRHRCRPLARLLDDIGNVRSGTRGLRTALYRLSVRPPPWNTLRRRNWPFTCRGDGSTSEWGIWPPECPYGRGARAIICGGPSAHGGARKISTTCACPRHYRCARCFNTGFAIRHSHLAVDSSQPDTARVPVGDFAARIAAVCHDTCANRFRRIAGSRRDRTPAHGPGVRRHRCNFDRSYWRRGPRWSSLHLCTGSTAGLGICDRFVFRLRRCAMRTLCRSNPCSSGAAGSQKSRSDRYCRMASREAVFDFRGRPVVNRTLPVHNWFRLGAGALWHRGFPARLARNTHCHHSCDTNVSREQNNPGEHRGSGGDSRD
jgi:hypothetical protein